MLFYSLIIRSILAIISSKINDSLDITLRISLTKSTSTLNPKSELPKFIVLDVII